MLLEHFTKGTERTSTGSLIGAEIETDFIYENGAPIRPDVTEFLLTSREGRPDGCQQKLELGRQKIEISVAPKSTIEELMTSVNESLDWLYRRAAIKGARPQFLPEFDYPNPLLYVQEERDALWVELDGQHALEFLCRCSSVQFTVAVNPTEAIACINRLWEAKLHEVDYSANNRLWQAYIRESRVSYRSNRYAGPSGFTDLAEYVARLSEQEVLMHKGHPVHLPIDNVQDLDIELFLRSVWWHYRLRRYGDTLALEMRPFARRTDDQIIEVWKRIATVLGI